MITVENLHQVFTEKEVKTYQFEISRELSRHEIKLIESVIANVLNEKGREEY